MFSEKAHLALAERALGAMFNPGGAAEARDAVLVHARLGDVVADGVGLAGVGDAAGTALALGHHGELTVHGRAGQGPAVHLPLLPSRWRRSVLRDGRIKAEKRSEQSSQTWLSSQTRISAAWWRQRLSLMGKKVREQEILDEQSNIFSPICRCF